MNTYAEFLKTKSIRIPSRGPTVDPEAIHTSLFPFQRDLVRWGTSKGRAALFADTGLGKTRMQIEVARLWNVRSLIIAPLSVGRQTAAEGEKIGVYVHQTRSGADLHDGINITNYEMIEHFNPSDFGAVVLDESSVLKDLKSKRRALLTEMFAATEFRLCCTATPAPNDIAEIANHAQFLGIMTRAEMLASFFVHDSDGWRLKGHARAAFYKWLASWAMSVRHPSDLGYSDEGYILPELTVNPRWVDTDYVPEGQLFFTRLHGIQDRTKVRQGTLDERVAAAVDLIKAGIDEQWIAWCGLNDEQSAVAAALGEDCVSIDGKTEQEDKDRLLDLWLAGGRRVLVTKPSVLGFGLNLQNASKMVFVGLGDSWEAYYQCIRRSWRFGQTRPVGAYIVLSTAEEEIYRNVMNKEREATAMAEELVKNVAEFERDELEDDVEGWEYQTAAVEGDFYKLMLGDSTERLSEIGDESVHLSIFSPPFKDLFVYSPTERDLGNSRTPEQFFEHFGFIIRDLLRVTKPGRNACVHVAQIPAMLERDGYIGLKDFRGDVIRAFERDGWIYYGEMCIEKNPQAQAIRVHAKGLSFQQLHKDSSWMRPALTDYILVFRKPGENAVPVVPDLTNDQWIEWANPIWYGIRESETLNAAEGREKADERHICPLQLEPIERCITLYSNPGETVLTPFLGIGSEVHEAVRLGRFGIGIELKPAYFRAAVRNVKRALVKKTQVSLFPLFEQIPEAVEA